MPTILCDLCVHAGISNAYCGTKDDMRRLVDTLAKLEPLDKPLTATDLSGRWELAYTTVELFRASPFFQMVRHPRSVQVCKLVCVRVLVNETPDNDRS